MTIEHYSEKYREDVVKLAENFHREAIHEFDEILDPKVLMNAIMRLSCENSGNAFLLIEDDKCQGILAGMEYQSMMSGKRIFQEIIWYVNEPFRKHGVRLFKTAEKILKSRGVGMMVMVVMENSKTKKIKRFYERIGFKPLEVHYMRNL